MEGKNIKKIAFMLSIILILTACGKMSTESVTVYNHTNKDIEEVENIFAADDRLRNVVAVMQEEQFIAGVTVGTFERFSKKKIEKDLEEQIRGVYPESKILVSADNKVVIETTKMSKIKDQEELKKKIKKIKLLSEEET